MLKEARKFLLTVAGSDGLQAITKASAQFNELSNIFLPRAIISWLSVSNEASYVGRIPGLSSDNVVRLSKNESSTVYVNGSLHTIDPKNPETLIKAAAAIAVAMGAYDNPIPDNVEPEQVSKMSKSLDLLVKSKVIAWLQEEKSESSDEESSSSSSSDDDIEVNEELDKGVDMPGKAAAPRGPVPPFKQSPPKKGVHPEMNIAPKITKSEAFSKASLKSACKACGKSQLHERWNTLVGCDCVSQLLKNEKPRVDISFDRDIYLVTADSETVMFLKEVLDGTSDEKVE